MSQVKIVNPDFEELATLESVLSAARTEKINSDNVLNLTFLMKDSASANVNAVNLYQLGSDYFDLAKYVKAQQADGKRLVTVETEHISYRLNKPDYDKEYFTEMGTPTYILGKILEGTGFTVGTVEFTNVVTYSAQKKMSRRQILMEFVAYHPEFDIDIQVVINKGNFISQGQWLIEVPDNFASITDFWVAGLRVRFALI